MDHEFLLDTLCYKFDSFDRSKNSRIRSFGKRGAKMDQPRVYAASAFRLDKNTSYYFFARFFSDRELKISSPKVIIHVCCAAYSVAHPYCDTAESFHYNLYRSAFFCALIFSGRIKLQICRNSSCDYDSCRCDLFLPVAVQPNQPFFA